MRPYKTPRIGETEDLLRSGTWFTPLDNTLMPPRLAPFACILILREVAFHLQAQELGSVPIRGPVRRCNGKKRQNEKRGSEFRSSLQPI